MIRFTTYIVILAILSPLTTAEDPCRFETNKGVIDLTSLSHSDGTAAFPDVIPQTGTNYKYSYNPCKPFSEGNDCNDTAVCQVSLDGAFTFVLGTQNSTKWDAGSDPDSKPTIHYSSGNKQVYIELICDKEKNDSLVAFGENPQEVYSFQMTGKCACWNGCPGEGPSGGGSVPVGLVFIIILLVGASIYLNYID